ncbi:hypothetical protein PR048_026285 [Dryococelus australis]|uniref:Uncharacterized protein n=1 Tax=Dryococelus australis TaxID=614101 RepID=A0ABQ9GKW6_9NEOP|nr:hypothetical protein PR048_026285 [Dryococelus australis]
MQCSDHLSFRRNCPIHEENKVRKVIEEIWTALNIEGGVNGRFPRKRHGPARFPHAKIRNESAGDLTRITLMGGEQANRSATVASNEVSKEQRRNVRGEREIPEKTRRPAASPGTIPTCKNPGATPTRIEQVIRYFYTCRCLQTPNDLTECIDKIQLNALLLELDTIKTITSNLLLSVCGITPGSTTEFQRNSDPVVSVKDSIRETKMMIKLFRRYMRLSVMFRKSSYSPGYRFQGHMDDVTDSIEFSATIDYFYSKTLVQIHFCDWMVLMSRIAGVCPQIPGTQCRSYLIMIGPVSNKPGNGVLKNGDLTPLKTQTAISFPVMVETGPSPYADKLAGEWGEQTRPISGPRCVNAHSLDSIKFSRTPEQEVLRVGESEMRCEWSSAVMQGRGEVGALRESPPTSGIIRHDSHMRKSGSGPAGNGARFATVKRRVVLPLHHRGPLPGKESRRFLNSDTEHLVIRAQIDDSDQNVFQPIKEARRSCSVSGYGLSASQGYVPYTYKGRKSCKETCIAAARDWFAMASFWP